MPEHLKTFEHKKGKWVGKRLARKEDLWLLTGRGTFMDDIRLPGMKHAGILRSPYPHAWIRGIDVSEALKLPGVKGILTGEDVERMSNPFPVGVPVPPKYYCCAVDKVRFVGEPVAVVVADDRYIAEDALDLIKVDYEPLPVVMDIEEAMEPDAPILHDNIGSNIYSQRFFQYGDMEKAYKEADLVVKGKFHFPKYGSTPIETYGVIASYNPFSEEFVIYNNYQGPFVNHSLVAIALGIPENKMRWIVPKDIGGGFGTKTGLYPYIALITLAAKKTGMTVKWIEDRREHLLASATGTDRVTYMEAAVKRDGTILGLKDKAIDNTGGIREVFAKARERHPDKPLYTVILGGKMKQRWLHEIDGLSIPAFETTHIAVKALAAAWRYAKEREHLQPDPLLPQPPAR